MEIVNTIKELLTSHPLYNEHFKFYVQFGAVNLHDPGPLADIGAFLTSAEAETLQVLVNPFSSSLPFCMMCVVAEIAEPEVCCCLDGGRESWRSLMSRNG